jgi:glyoxylase-like metal-dependent hydrolase (beta-lactamase superfamily II)
MVNIGSITIRRINDSDYWVDPGGPFGLVPRALWARYFPPTDDHLVKMSSNVLLVQTSGQNILIDTGYGHKMPEKQQAILRLSRPQGDLTDGLARAGLRPEDIHLVIATHLHADHVSGCTRYDETGRIVPVFPNALYVVQRREYQDASQPNERTRATYLAENFEPLVVSGQMRLLDGDTDLAPGVRGVITPGHTPGHMSIVFESDGQYGVQVCDMATYAVHFERLGWMTAYDVEPLVTLETKRRWQQWAREHDAVIFFPHDPYRPYGKLTQDAEGRPYVEPLDSALLDV